MVRGGERWPVLAQVKVPWGLSVSFLPLSLREAAPAPVPEPSAPLCPAEAARQTGRNRESGDFCHTLEQGTKVLCDPRQEWNLSEHWFPYL